MQSTSDETTTKKESLKYNDLSTEELTILRDLHTQYATEERCIEDELLRAIDIPCIAWEVNDAGERVVVYHMGQNGPVLTKEEVDEWRMARQHAFAAAAATVADDDGDDDTVPELVRPESKTTTVVNEEGGQIAGTQWILSPDGTRVPVFTVKMQMGTQQYNALSERTRTILDSWDPSILQANDDDDEGMDNRKRVHLAQTATGEQPLPSSIPFEIKTKESVTMTVDDLKASILFRMAQSSPYANYVEATSKLLDQEASFFKSGKTVTVYLSK